MTLKPGLDADADIVVQLRQAPRRLFNVGATMEDLTARAANEIERLRTERNTFAARLGAERLGTPPLARENARLRARERKIIDTTWAVALMDKSVPSTKLQDRIIASVDAADVDEQETGRPKQHLVGIDPDQEAAKNKLARMRLDALDRKVDGQSTGETK